MADIDKFLYMYVIFISKTMIPTSPYIFMYEPFNNCGDYSSA